MESERCPACGGIERVEILPGLVECRGEIRTVEYVRSRDVFAEMATGQPRIREDAILNTKICRRRYEVDAPMSTDVCRGAVSGQPCGRYSIGVCITCASPICRRHAHLEGESLYCSRCVEPVRAPRMTEARQEAQEQMKQRIAQARLAEEEALERHRRREAEAPGWPKPPEGIGEVRSNAFGDVLHMNSGTHGGPTLKEICECLRRLLPHRQGTYLIEKRVGMLGRPKYITGCGFAIRGSFIRGEGMGPDPEITDLFTHFIFTPDAKVYRATQYVSKGQPLDRFDYAPYGRLSGPDVRLSWYASELIRSEVTKLLSSS